jgi:HlyD family secretion protein
MNNGLVKFLVNNWMKGVLLTAAIVVVVFFIQTNNVETEQIHVVTKHDVEQVVLLSGSVKAVDQVDLSFDAAGKVASTAVSQADVVKKGQLLAELDYGVLKADLLQAQGQVQSAESSVSLAQASVQKAEANLALVQAQNRGTDSSITAAKTSLTNTISEQAILVQNAYSDLLNNDLIAYPVDNNRNVPSPIVSGNYTAEVVGEYVLDFYNSRGGTGYSVMVSGLSGKTISFNDFGIPAPLGTQGLYLTLPESGEAASYGNTDWVIPVPNTRSATYQTKLGAYNKALQTQSAAVANAQSNVDTLQAQQEKGDNIAITTAQVQQANAALQEAKANLKQALSSLAQARVGVTKVQAQIENSIIKAPFDGVVARFNFEVGQSVTSQNTGITLVTDGDYELLMSIPEIDVAKVDVGDGANIILDVYGSDVVWEGVLSEIELIETEIDGVPSYSSTITILDPDERIKIGMNARARIVVNEKKDVIAIPSSYVINNGDISTVLVKQNERQVVEQVVKTGLQGTDFFIEITEGLTSGDTIIMPAG